LTRRSRVTLRSLLLSVRRFANESGLLLIVLGNPTLSASEREQALQSLTTNSSSILSNLLQVLSENGRLSQTSKVFADFNSLISAYRGELEVSVTSAEALDSKTMSRLEKALKGSKEAEGKTLKIVNKVRSLSVTKQELIF
jgi:F-type H+-transporting ATPase subunit O